MLVADLLLVPFGVIALQFSMSFLDVNYHFFRPIEVDVTLTTLDDLLSSSNVSSSTSRLTCCSAEFDEFSGGGHPIRDGCTKILGNDSIQFVTRFPYRGTERI